MKGLSLKKSLWFWLFISSLALALHTYAPVTSASQRNGAGGAQIAYLAIDGIYLLDLATNQTTHIVNNDSVVSFAWSPDGQWISYEVVNAMAGCCGGGVFISDMGIGTIKPDGTDLTGQEIKNTGFDQYALAYSPSSTLYHVERIMVGGQLMNTIVTFDVTGHSHQIYEEPGDLCNITNLSFYSDKWAVISRECGPNMNVSVVGLASGVDVPLAKDKCVTSGVWSTKVGIIATAQSQCGDKPNGQSMAFFYPDGSHADEWPMPGADPSSLDITSQTDFASPAITSTTQSGSLPNEFGSSYITYVVGNAHGLWLVADNGDEAQISNVGGVPRWRPTGAPAPPTDFPTLCWSSPCRIPLATAGRGQLPVPTAGRGQLVDDWIAWGALVACVAIGAGFVLVSLRRRRGGDGL